MATLTPERPPIASAGASVVGPVGQRDPEFGSVAIVHDYLNQPGGAERLVLALAQMWPDAPIYTSLYRADSTFPAFGAADVRSSPLDVLPVDDSFRSLFAFYPAAFRSFGVLDQDLVISSSSGWAHSVRTAPHTFHAVYCHSPARWLYEPQHLDDARTRTLRPFVQAMRNWDRGAAHRAQLYIANSAEVRHRIRRWYGIDAPVVHPPVAIERFRARPRGERLLVVSRLLPYKRIDAIVDVATRAGIGLDVVGSGPALEDLRRRAGPTVEFHGRLADDAVIELMQSCRALCLPGKEDFGITPVEAIAAGKPVVALAAGGALETVQEGITGAFFTHHTHDEILAAIRRADAIDATPEAISAAARRFSSHAFEVRLRDVLTVAKDAQPEGGRPGLAVLAPAARPSLGHELKRSTRRSTPIEPARTLMLGHGWFPHILGGLDRYYRDLLENLPEARGVVIGQDASTPARVAGVSGHGRPLPLRLLAFWRATQRQADAVDVVDAQFALYSLLPLRIGRLRHKPVVLHFHGPWAYENVSSGDRSRLRRELRMVLERAAYSRADQAVVLTSAFRRILVERYRVPPWIVNVEPPGVDLDRFSPGSVELARQELGLSAEAFVAVAVRRLVPRMGLELLIETWRDCLADLPAGSTLLIAGEGPLESALRAAAAQCVPGSVRLLGRVSDDQLVSMYRAADVAVVPTLEHEGFGLVVLEAAACGTPSIVTAVGGLPEVAAGLDPSLIVAPGDPSALGERLVLSATQRPSRAATRAYAERYAWDGVAERHREIAQRAISVAEAGRGARRRRGERGGAAGAGDQRLKVVYLDHVARMSGGEIALLRLLPHLDDVQKHVILAEEGPLVDELHRAGISTEVMPYAARARDLRKDTIGGHGLPTQAATATAAYVLRLARRLRELQPDVVHSNSLKAGVYGSLAARLAGVPMVWHVRDRIADDYLPHAAVMLVRQMTRQLPGAVLANSRCTLETLRAPTGTQTVYRVLPDVLGDVRPRARTRGNDPTLTFGVVGRLAPWKGQDLFLRAFAQAFPDGQERAVIVGGALFGEDGYAAQLPRLAEELGISERVELRGHCSDVWSELAQLDVLVHSSVTPEPFGQVILEGMAARLPVIAADAGGPAEIIQSDVTGVLYRPCDAAELSKAMVRMCDPSERERLSTAAQGTLARYSPTSVASELRDLYVLLAEQKRLRRG